MRCAPCATASSGRARAPCATASSGRGPRRWPEAASGTVAGASTTRAAGAAAAAERRGRWLGSFDSSSFSPLLQMLECHGDGDGGASTPALASASTSSMSVLDDRDWQAADEPDPEAVGPQDGANADAQRVDDHVAAIDDATEEVTAEEAFFGLDPEPPESSRPRQDELPEEELERYLRSSRSWTVRDCFGLNKGKREFPRLARLFLKYNTALPSSASVERFFSRCGLSFTALRNALGDRTLEAEVLLGMNRRFWVDDNGAADD